MSGQIAHEWSELGPTRGLPPANWGGGGTHIHAMHAGGRFGTSVE